MSRRRVNLEHCVKAHPLSLPNKGGTRRDSQPCQHTTTRRNDDDGYATIITTTVLERRYYLLELLSHSHRPCGKMPGYDKPSQFLRFLVFSTAFAPALSSFLDQMEHVTPDTGRVLRWDEVCLCAADQINVKQARVQALIPSLGSSTATCTRLSAYCPSPRC